MGDILAPLLPYCVHCYHIPKNTQGQFCEMIPFYLRQRHAPLFSDIILPYFNTSILKINTCSLSIPFICLQTSVNSSQLLLKFIAIVAVPPILCYCSLISANIISRCASDRNNFSVVGYNNTKIVGMGGNALVFGLGQGTLNVLSPIFIGLLLSFHVMQR